MITARSRPSCDRCAPALTNTDRPESVLTWIRRPRTELPPEHRQFVQPFGLWHVLHRAGRRSHQFGPRTAQAAAKDRRYIHTAAAFLAWVAGALVLLFGIALARVLHLTTTDVTFSKDVPSGITFGKQPIPLPPKIAAVVAKLINDRGRPATTPITLQALSQALTRNGITAHLDRTAAMLDLAADIPAAVLADLLGMSAGTTDKWNRLTSRDRTHYLEARTDTT